MGSGIDDLSHRTDRDGNPNVLNANRNDDGRWLNAYWDKPSNKWNTGGASALLVPETGFISESDPV
ncbi:MAG: hypothetical protein JWO58_3386, partial [Chitinophagaceae bacterium]|nr:hypothetical protein [Chitinophagaceae bacterium]